jgi:hypothetical protein
MIEKRIHQRFGPLVIKASFTQGGLERDGYLTNVSVSGAFFAVESPPPTESEVELKAVLPWRLGELRASARVVWRSEGGGDDERSKLAGAGLLFTRLDPSAERLLHAYLDRFVELAAQIDDPTA